MNIRSVETYPKKHEFGVAFDDMVGRLDWRGLDIFWKFKRFFNVGGEWHIRRDHKVVQQFVNGLLDEKNLGKTTASIRDADGGREQFDLLSLFMKHNPDLEHDLTRDQLRDIALNFIVEFLSGFIVLRILAVYQHTDCWQGHHADVDELVHIRTLSGGEPDGETETVRRD